MTFGKRIASAFAMSDAVWERHANPWSAWTRFPLLPLFALAIWARAWIGWWCLVPLAALMLWTWHNPRAFAVPVSTRSWASRSVMGERIWLAQANSPIPAHHAIWAWVLAALPALGMPPLIWGLWSFELWPVLMGLVLTVGAKMWFLDRMAWLFDDMAREHPEYRAWLR